MVRGLTLRYVLAGVAVTVPVAVMLAFGQTTVMVPGWVHFAGVGLAAAIASAAAIALTIAGALQGDGRAMVAGLAFSLMAALLCLHGVATPGFLVAMNGVVAFTGAATLPVGCVILAFGALPALRGPRAARPLLFALALGTLAVVVLGVSAILDPALVPAVPEAASLPALLVLGVGAVACALLVLRATRTYRLTQRVADLCVAVGIVWLAVSLSASLLLDYWDLGWWLGHGFEIVGIALVGIPVALDLRRSAAIRSNPLIGDLSARCLVLSEESFLGSHVRALLVALAAKDDSTEEHTRRVALRAVEVGEELGLPAGRLRTLALGGLLHDIGKLSVPDEILSKPGALTDEEFGVVRRHPGAGVALLHELGGFDDGVISLVRDHHERLDGSGYPRGLREEELSLDARIIAVCDVYDALVSSRVYRDAWTHERALALLRDGAGTSFDARCVDALERVTAREGTLPRARPEGSPAVAPAPAFSVS